MSLRLHPVTIALVFAGWAGCHLPEDEQELTAETALPLNVEQTLWGNKSNAGAPASWWHDTGINIDSIHYRFRFTWGGGLILPWPGHPGLGFGGDGSFWSQSLDPGCPYGSLIGKVENGSSFCIGNVTDWIYPRNTGRLYLAFNDGVNFEDNNGAWLVQIALQLDAPKIKMPFDGYIDKNGLAVPPETLAHPRRDLNGITEWTTDVFPAGGPGTYVVFRVSDGVVGQVVDKVNTCTGTAAGGKTLIIDLMQNDIRIGRVLYGHLGGTLPAVWQNLTSGAVLGQAIAVPTPDIDGCYEGSGAQDSHVHFELGTRKDTMGTSNRACWATYSRDALRDSTAKLGQFGLTGLPDVRACP